MSQICILTDFNAIFDSQDFPGSSLTYVIGPSGVGLTRPSTNIKLESLSKNANGDSQLAPSANAFKQAFLTLAHNHNEIIVILSSSQISKSIYQNAIAAAESLKGKLSIQIIDSQTIGPGLGKIVSGAAFAISDNMTASEVYRYTQQLLAHIYTIFCTKELKRLSQIGVFDSEHALLGEMLGITPIMILENGLIVSTQKARNSRHLVEIFLEYLEEFYLLKKIYIFQTTPVFSSEFNQLRDRISVQFPETPITSLLHHPIIENQIGHRSMGMVVIDT